MAHVGSETAPSATRLDLGRNGLDLVEDAEQVSAPDHADLFFGLAATDQLERRVERLRGVVPATDATATVEVGADADVLDSDQID